MTRFSRPIAMKGLMLAATAVLVCGRTALAQDEAPSMDLAPAAGLAKFERTLGHWRTTGKVWMAPGTEPLPWSSTSHVRRILDGHVIQEDASIEFAPGMPALHFRSFVGWDQAADRPVSYSIANTGEGGRQEVRWIGETTLVTTSNYVEAGVPVCERAVMEYGAGTYTFRVDRARGGDPFFLYVQGDAQRVGDGDESFGALPGTFWSPTGAPPEGVARLAPLASMAGTYRLEGTVQPMPGMPDMPITGTDECSLMYGGAILAFRATGQGDMGPAWEGHAYQWWEPERSCHVMLHLDNMGGIGTSEAHMLDGRHLVATSARVTMGQPMVERTVVALDEKGHIATATSHAISGVGEPTRTFHAEYTRVEAAAPASQAFKAGSCCDRAQQAGGSCAHPCCVKAAEAGEVCAACN